LGRMRLILPILVIAVALPSCVTTPGVRDPNVQPADLAGYTTWVQVNAAPLTGDPFGAVGQGHGGAEAIREIYVNDAGKAVSAAGAGFPYPVGTVIVEETYGRLVADGKGSLTQISAMVKRAPGYDPAGGDWEFMLVKPDLTLAARGKLPTCIACHAAASGRDFVFTNGRTTVK
jgi:hypothetical protein